LSPILLFWWFRGKEVELRGRIEPCLEHLEHFLCLRSNVLGIAAYRGSAEKDKTEVVGYRSDRVVARRVGFSVADTWEAAAAGIEQAILGSPDDLFKIVR
jgi:hypothetical protein